MTRHHGGCQCGAVRYSVEADIKEVMACNCSRCGKLGSLLAFVPEERFALEKGEGAMTEFLFNKNAIHHLFCATCGIESFARGQNPKGDRMVAVNVRCLDDFDETALTIKHINGKAF